MAFTGVNVEDDRGPYSALIDYDEEAKKEEARKLQLLESQKKIQRGNAIGDAFRLLFDGIGGSMGATIAPKTANTGIFKASDEMKKINTDSDTRMDRLKLTDLTNKTRDLQYQQGLEAEKRGNQQREKENQAQFEHQDFTNNQNRQFQQEAAKTNLDNQMTLEDKRTKNNINEYSAKTKIAQDALNPANADRKKRVSKEDVEFRIPNSNETIYLRPSEIQEMQYRLTNGKTAYDPELDKALKALIANKGVQDDATILVLKKNWDKIKDVIPGYAGQKPVEPTAAELRQAEYQQKVDELNSNTQLKSHKREKQLRDLQDEYKDVLNTASASSVYSYTPKAEPQQVEIIKPVDGVTDVSSIFD